MKLRKSTQSPLTAECLKGGTLAEFRMDAQSTDTFIGIVVTDIDGDNKVVVDVENGFYYEDVNMYPLVRIIEADLVENK